MPRIAAAMLLSANAATPLSAPPMSWNASSTLSGSMKSPTASGVTKGCPLRRRCWNISVAAASASSGEETNARFVVALSSPGLARCCRCEEIEAPVAAPEVFVPWPPDPDLRVAPLPPEVKTRNGNANEPRNTCLAAASMTRSGTRDGLRGSSEAPTAAAAAEALMGASGGASASAACRSSAFERTTSAGLSPSAAVAAPSNAEASSRDSITLGDHALAFSGALVERTASETDDAGGFAKDPSRGGGCFVSTPSERTAGSARGRAGSASAALFVVFPSSGDVRL